VGISDRKEREKEDLHKSILDAAREVFLEKGYDQTSIRNIAQKIEYSPTTIYLYFKDKDAIFLALHEDGFKLLNNEMVGLFSIEDPYERLITMGRVYLDFARRNPDFYDLMFVQKAPIESLENKSWEDGLNAFKGLEMTIQQCMDLGYFKFDDAEVAAFLVWSTMHGMCTLNNRDRCIIISEPKQEQIIELAFNAFIAMLDQLKK
jgi:AcrR family transcriptional regulator